MNQKSVCLLALLFLSTLFSGSLRAEDGYKLWLQYDQVQDATKLQAYRQTVNELVVQGSSPTLTAVQKELQMGLQGLLGKPVPASKQANQQNILVAGTPASSALIKALNLDAKLKTVGDEGYLLLTANQNGKKQTVIAANTDIGVLYGSFHFLRLLQTHQDISNLSVASAPKIKHRVLNHWDNLDRTVERGYAGFSLWDWHRLPGYIDQRYIDYARANASIGINGTVLTNVNANALVLTEDYLKKVAALADAFRPYGLKVYLTARFSAPIEIGGLKTADPLDPQVQAWWNKKSDEIYSHIPDFGGFLVKANSEGQPGPQNYGRNHADGANMLADAVAGKGGIVMWRAFVYSEDEPDDRAKQAYNEFKPLDGKFRDNVLVQVKNGAIDFQPREPFHPLFGAMPKTPLMMEFQITQEYLGQGTTLAYLSPMYKETLEADTYAEGKGSTVAKVVDGTLHNYQQTGIAGVANIGNDRNWTGHLFGQSNWYAFGRLAWNHALSSEEIAEEWVKMTFTNDNKFVAPVKDMMLTSHEAVVNYMTPLGLHHIMGWSHHYGPGPWIKDKHRADWTSVYYHKADEKGIGFDRTKSGSNAVSQYFPPVAKTYGNIKKVPEKYLLWFHHVPWDYKVNSGRTLWNELAYRYSAGVDSVRQMQKTWDSLQGKVDEERFQHVKQLLAVQEQEAEWWRDACLLYFQTFSKRPIPADLEKPAHTLDYYMSLDPKFVPGI
ncbi:alpha-glucuronidase family glycosyl hydrolase [Pontibacter akesuensis]|uniref:Xylan alpha-1,2-glucuronidase n=1 Tax=Pontibacter akesuensis TaxID=388950 RepID=A0A1I7JZG9_9BACT|nr:alpha-glucuronidase family glycosyl hydrolase [Pontibacter akesuensis]GHA76291.1 xylan alpha-1,2-glucuronidase [Pontibacter akesuensis]SFU90567.1 alpha-glucuronidase [Pontibacter akesuensis]